MKEEYLLSTDPEQLSDDLDTQKLIKDAQEKAKKFDMPYVKIMWIKTIKESLRIAEKKKELVEETKRKVKENYQRIEEYTKDLKVIRKKKREAIKELREFTKKVFKKI